jgi:hypothetical protein
MAFVAALPVLTQAAIGFGAVTTVAGIKQAGAAGKFNQSVANRNAQIAEQEAAQIEKQKEFDIAKFDQQFVQLQGQTKTRVLFSGADLSGSGLRILRRNAEQAEVEKNIIDYNAKIGQAQKFEEANFARIQGSMARQQARMQQIQIASAFGSSLLSSQGKTT